LKKAGPVLAVFVKRMMLSDPQSRKSILKEGLISTIQVKYPGKPGRRKNKKRAAKAALKVKQGEKSDALQRRNLPESGSSGYQQ
jgi:hypothetical protein